MDENGEHQPPFDKPPHDKPEHRMRRDHMPPPIVGERDILALVVLILMFGANLGTKYYFRSRDDQKRLAELERQNLEQQLEYLRYQINPHFFMNTLNNIHALVDIDPAKAQETIVELSKMMRFVLYEGDKRGVPLARELEFIRTYLKLMQLRFTDQVRISQNLPAEVPDRNIPPLLLITFVENAFKHGVSYQQESYIELQAAVEDERLVFSCRNSKASKPNQEKGGVGLTNVRKRLDLLFKNDYSLDIHDEADSYAVELNIPLS
jgi:LytS/YehU family sensor histidine kinase